MMQINIILNILCKHILSSVVLLKQFTMRNLFNFLYYIDSVACNQCGDLKNRIPCSKQEIYQNSTNHLKCSEDKPFCMTDIMQDATGRKDVYKRYSNYLVINGISSTFPFWPVFTILIKII